MTLIRRALTAIQSSAPVLRGPIDNARAYWRSIRRSQLGNKDRVAPQVADLRPVMPEGRLLDVVAAVLDNPDFKSFVAFCASWPENSTVTPVERALMVWVIKATAARHVLEIGTYFAGTTFALASAVAAGGGGEVYTIDPYGAKRAPAIIGKFPPELASIIKFRAVYSCEFLLMMNIVPPFDLVFIDGSHAYPNVIHDIYGSALNAVRGGYIFIDNAEQPEVLAATRDYLTLNPEVEGALVSTDAGALFKVEHIHAGPTLKFAYAILRLPRMTSIGASPLSYHLFDLTVRRFRTVRVAFDAPVAGSIKIDFHLRSIHRDPTKEQSFDLFETHSVDVDGGPGDISLPLTLELAPETDGQVNFAEISVSFSNSDRQSKLGNIRLFVDGRELMPGRNVFR